MSRPPRVVSAAIAGAVILVLALAGAGGPVLGAGHAVRIVDTGGYNSAFSPRSISIRAGDRVTWTNDSFTQHNVTFSSFGSPTYMDPGTRYGHTFASPGTYHYTCTLHGFSGTVVVTGAANTPKPTAKPTAKPTPKPTPRPTAKATASPTTAPTASPAATSASSPEPSASPSAVAVVATAPPASPGPTTSPSSPASSGDSTLPLLLLFGLVAVAVVGLAVFARRRT